MRHTALVLALGFTMICVNPVRLEASGRDSNAASIRRAKVKVKRNKVNGRRAPRRVKRSRNRVN